MVNHIHISEALCKRPCLNCPEMDLDIHTSGKFKDGVLFSKEHNISCSCEKICENLMNYLGEELKNEESIQKESPDE